MSSTHQIRRGTVLLYISFLATGVVGLAIQKLLTSFFQPTEYGVYMIFLTVASFCLSLLGLGLPEAVQRYIPQYLAKEHYAKLRRFCLYTTLVTMALSLLPVAVMILFRERLISGFNLPVLPILFFAATGIYIFFSIVVYLLNSTLIGFGAFGTRTIGDVLFGIARVGAILFVGITATTLTHLFVVLSVAYLCYFLFLIFGVLRQFRFLKITPEPSTVETSEIAKYSLSRFFSTFMDTILEFTFDIYMITWLLGAEGPAAAGIYGLGVTLTNMALNFNPGRIGFPAIKNYVLRQHDEVPDAARTSLLCSFYSKLMLYFYFLVSVGAWFLAPPFFRLFFPPEYFESAGIFSISLLILSIALAFNFPFNLMTDILKLKRVHLYSRVSVIVNLGLNYLWIPIYGLYGALAATGISRFFVVLILYFYLARYQKLKLDWRGLGLLVLNVIPAGAVLYFTAGLADSYLMCGIIILLATAVFVGTGKLLPIFTRGERDIMKSVFPASKHFL